MASECTRSVCSRALGVELLILTLAQGTWQFISAVLLAFPGRFKYAVWHDLESFIHVLHWMCLRFQLTNYTGRPTKFSERIRQLYDACATENGQSIGGEDKLRFLQAGSVPFKLRGGSSTGKANGLHQLLQALANLYGEHYRLLEPSLDALEPATHEQAAAPFKKTQKFGASSRTTALSKQLVPELSTPPETPITGQEATATPLQKPDLAASPFTHDEILAVFSVILERAWTDDVKQDDQFKEMRDRLKQEAGSGWKRGLKRRSDDSREDSSAKRSRNSGEDVRSPTTMSTPELGSISEGMENVFGRC